MSSEVEAPKPTKRESFLKRLFSDEGTPKQRVFDVLFGIIAPILALAFDPILFRVDESCTGISPFLGDYTLFAYLSIALGILALAIWLIAERRLGLAVPFFAGVLLAGALFAGYIGVRLLPFSLLGLIYVIGILGFIPLVTSFVYLRNGRRAALRTIKAAQGVPRVALVIVIMLVAAALVLGIPALAQWRAMTVIEQATQTLVSNPTNAERNQALQNLKQFNTLCFGLCRSMIYDEFSEWWYKDRERYYPVLKEAYEEATGIILIDCSDV